MSTFQCVIDSKQSKESDTTVSLNSLNFVIDDLSVIQGQQFTAWLRIDSPEKIDVIAQDLSSIVVTNEKNEVLQSLSRAQQLAFLDLQAKTIFADQFSGVVYVPIPSFLFRSTEKMKVQVQFANSRMILFEGSYLTFLPRTNQAQFEPTSKIDTTNVLSAVLQLPSDIQKTKTGLIRFPLSLQFQGLLEKHLSKPASTGTNVARKEVAQVVFHPKNLMTSTCFTISDCKLTITNKTNPKLKHVMDYKHAFEAFSLDKIAAGLPFQNTAKKNPVFTFTLQNWMEPKSFLDRHWSDATLNEYTLDLGITYKHDSDAKRKAENYVVEAWLILN